MTNIKLINDNSCGWLKQLQKRINIKTLNQNLKSDYLIVGAGYTGLSAARKLSEIHKNKKIIIIDAQLAGEGGSSRNSGYLVAFFVTFFYLISPIIIKIFKIISIKYKLIADFILVISLSLSLILILIYHQEVNQFIYFQF